MALGKFFGSLFSSGAKGFVEAVGDAIDKNVTNDEERLELEHELTRTTLQHEREMRSLDLQETQAFLQDNDSARVNQSRVQESAHASWLAKNVHSLLAVAVVGLTFLLYFWILGLATKPSAEDGVSALEMMSDQGVKDIVIYILGALTTVSTQVIAYFFGSSQGSKDKQQTLANLTSTGNNGKPGQ